MTIRAALANRPGRRGCAAIAMASLIGLLCVDSAADAVPSSNAQHSCYRSVGLERPSSVAPLRYIVIAVDQTTLLPPGLLERALSIVDTTLVAGSRISLVSFSAYSAQHHLRHELTLEMEQLPSEQDTHKIPIAKTQALQRCLELQAVRHGKLLRAAITAATASASRTIERSEIIAAMRMLGTRLGGFQGSRTLLMISDGLEHAPGATTTFYAQRELRRIDPQPELERVKSKGQLANLSKVNVHFFGGGLSADESSYRDLDSVTAVAHFWSLYVAASGGVLVEFGTPELHSPVIR